MKAPSLSFGPYPGAYPEFALYSVVPLNVDCPGSEPVSFFVTLLVTLDPVLVELLFTDHPYAIVCLE